ncbi:putative Urea amidolyase [Glarea lozoyensis 74030]|uniref:Putative Urea amidolyase n=1 Tax=Glarea lozoyensis (strain ATCC 74030 / MF5533) TaxID=1104152 RepID=H0EYD6_GLAL7|nr:putative Urea amidolyase [Glarea lozoyensis 74030]
MASSLSLPTARPYTYTFPPSTTALLLIDMQRDFVDPSGFGSIQCGNPEIFSAMVTTSMDIICGQDGLFGYIGDKDILPSISELQKGYKSGLFDPETTVTSVFERIEKYKAIDPAVWISIQPKEQVLLAAKALSAKYAGKPLPPLYGIPFALKDNIDVSGIPTTATCPQFAYTPTSTAPAVQHLLDAGALYIGKLNMDQLATGLSGCRSPYGTPHSVYSTSHISGGSSSGSAVAVAAGLVSFTLGTDTAGSGRVPAALNGIVGFKPTKGTISARGVVPACKSLDTLSIMAPTLAEARSVWYILDVHDALDPNGGFTFAIPPPSELSACTEEYATLFAGTVEKLRSLGGRLVEIDYTPFAQASGLLYNASLVHERLSSIGHSFLTTHLTSLHPTTQSLFASALTTDLKPWQVFHDQDLQRQYTMAAQRTFDTLEGGIDVLLVPSTPCHPTIAEMEAEPLSLNAKMGTFTHAGNVVDLCGVSVNAGWTGEKLPFGVTFLGGSGYDGRVLDIAAVFEEGISGESKATSGYQSPSVYSARR